MPGDEQDVEVGEHFLIGEGYTTVVTRMDN